MKNFTIKELRQGMNLTPSDMAEKLNIALSTYFDKEAGRRKFQPKEIVIICLLFDVRVEQVKDFS